MKKFQLTNTLVVVVRYFGGKKLEGIPGLIRSYKTQQMTLQKRGPIIINKKIMEQYDLEFHQKEMGYVMSCIKKNNIENI